MSRIYSSDSVSEAMGEITKSSKKDEIEDHCCCGRMHVVTGARVIALVNIALCLFNLVSLLHTVNSSTPFSSLFTVILSILLHISFSMLVIIGINQRISALLIPNLIIMMVTTMSLIIGSCLFLWAAFDPSSYAGQYLTNMNSEPIGVDPTADHQFDTHKHAIIAVSMSLMCSLLSILVIWWIKVNYDCYRHIKEEQRSQNRSAIDA